MIKTIFNLHFLQVGENYFASPRIGGFSINLYIYAFIIVAILLIFLKVKKPSKLLFIIVLLALIFLEILQSSDQIRKVQSTGEKFWGKSIEEKYVSLHEKLYLLSKAYKKQLPAESRIKLIISEDIEETMALHFEKILGYHLYPLDARNINRKVPVNYVISIIYDREKGLYYFDLRNRGNVSGLD